MWWIIGGVFLFLVLCIVVFVIILNQGIIPFVRLHKAPKKNQIRIACVGDSITYGYGVKRWIRNNYPHQLGTLLGNGYCVHNYGRCGATASHIGDLPYEETSEYQKSLSFHPDIVIMMLGTNDSKAHNYKSSKEYIDDCVRIRNSYKNNNKEIKIILITPPPAFEGENGLVKFDINPKIVEGMHQALLANKELAVIDLYQVLEGRKEMFWDGVHPNKDGASVIASAVYKAIVTDTKDYLKKGVFTK